jgi:hypothetical protein
MPKKLVITSIIALCMFLVVSMSAMAAEAEDLSGSWNFNWKWTDPPPPDPWQSATILITMNNPLIGTVEVDGLTGPIINIVVLVIWKWEIADPPLTLTYKGLALGNFMFGKMNQTGDYEASGIWFATRGAAGVGDASTLIRAPQ